jgi:hypothetical protein
MFQRVARILIAGVVLTVVCLTGCSVPNLEEPDCTKSRDIVREFYSFHLGNDMHPSQESIGLREKYLTTQLKDRLLATPPNNVDYFTATSDFPKAFRVGECKVSAPGQSVNFDILLFWKDDTRTEQQHISVGVRKENEMWRIDRVDR